MDASSLRSPVSLPHDFPFDPTYGYGERELLAITPPPEVPGFVDFWRDTFAETVAVPLRLEIEDAVQVVRGRRVRVVRFDTLGGLRIGAWWAMPGDGEVRRGCVTGHGYGGRGDAVSGWHPRHCAEIMPCAPGFNLSARPDLPDVALRHVLHGIASRETYLIRACVAAMWSAASALIELVPSVARGLFFQGTSFGGGLGALALPWDARLRGAFLEVPTFGHYPLRLRCPSVGSVAAMADYAAAHPEVLDVLAYYDAAVAAKHVQTPTVVAPARFDPAVPPPGQYAVANALPDKRLVSLTTGHFDNPNGSSESRAMRRAWRAVSEAQSGVG